MPKKLSDELCDYDDRVMVFCNDELVGGTVAFLNWAATEYGYEDFRNENLYETLRREEYALHLQATRVSSTRDVRPQPVV